MGKYAWRRDFMVHWLHLFIILSVAEVLTTFSDGSNQTFEIPVFQLLEAGASGLPGEHALWPVLGDKSPDKGHVIILYQIHMGEQCVGDTSETTVCKTEACAGKNLIFCLVCIVIYIFLALLPKARRAYGMVRCPLSVVRKQFTFSSSPLKQLGQI